MPESPTQTCPNCGRPLNEAAGCLACAMTQALQDAENAPELAGELAADRNAPAFSRLADPVPLLHAGRFRLVRRIASGGMGVVYEAHDTALDRVVALKMIRASRFASAEEQRRFELEARAAARLDHPHIVPVYEVGEIVGHEFLSMKHISGHSLASRLAAGRMETREAVALMVRLARAVCHAHERGVLHRDLKPSNVLIDEQGHPWLIDFGMARLADAAAGLTLEGSQIGTPNYMAPEQAAGRTQEVGQAADVWALGAMLYQMLTGELPYTGANHLAIMQSVINDPPPKFMPATKAEADLGLILERCFQKDYSRRLGDAGELADELERWLAGEAIRSKTSESSLKRKKCLRPALAAVLVFAAACFIFWQAVPLSPVDMEARVQQPEGVRQSFFGRSVAVEGDTMVVGAPLHEAGAAFVYQRGADRRWQLRETLKPTQCGPKDEFGRGVALHGDVLVIGAHFDDGIAVDSGAAHVFHREDGAWRAAVVLKASIPQAGAGFGRAVAVHGNTIVVGSRLEDGNGNRDVGAAHVFVREKGVWKPQARLTSPQPGSQHLFAISVAVEGDTLLVGADGEGVLEVPRHHSGRRPPSAGAAYVFTRSAGVWALQARLAPTPGCGGCFGHSVALSGEMALIGAYRDNSSTNTVNSKPDMAAPEAGAAFLFARNGGQWTQQAYLKPSNNGAGNRFGFDLALEGDLALIGAYAENSGTAYLFTCTGSSWVQTACLKAAEAPTAAHFGIGVALHSSTLVIGADSEYRSPFGNGQVWVFRSR